MRINNFTNRYNAKVFICAPVKNRAWILPEYLNALQNLDYPKNLLTFCFVLNDSIDESEKIIEDFSRKASEYGQQVIILRNDFGVDEWLREHRTANERNNLASLRNLLVDEFRKGSYDYFFSVDTDVIMNFDTLKKLIDCDKDIVGGWIYKTDMTEKRPVKGYESNALQKDIGETYVSYRDFPENSLFQANAVQSVYLVKKKVIDDGVRYNYYKDDLVGAPHKYSFFHEEIAFCSEAEEKGFQVWCHSGVFCEHRMMEISYESMAALLLVMKMKRYLLVEETQYSSLVELVTEQGEVIELGEYDAYEKLNGYRQELVKNIKFIEEGVQKIQNDIDDFFSAASPSMKLSELLPVFVDQCTALVNKVNTYAEEVSEIDLRNQLLLQKKLMILENNAKK